MSEAEPKAEKAKKSEAEPKAEKHHLLTPPPFPCVEMHGEAFCIDKRPEGKGGKGDGHQGERMFAPVFVAVSIPEDFEARVETLRRDQRYRVVAHHNFHKLPKGKVDEQTGEVRPDARELLTALVEDKLNPPEFSENSR